jgi:AcrR family transcriptional regulator
MTRKEQKEERKKAILMTALNLFVERGYYDTKITDIAEAVPMSTGLMFHYFESKEVLYTELVRMGAQATTSFGRTGDTGAGGQEAAAGDMNSIRPDIYFAKFLEGLFAYSKVQPWVFNMFVLMGQARRAGMPEEARQLALSVSGIDSSSKLIELGQKTGVFREGDPKLLATCFWATVQGIMEEMAVDKTLDSPDPEWIVAILKK